MRRMIMADLIEMSDASMAGSPGDRRCPEFLRRDIGSVPSRCGTLWQWAEALLHRATGRCSRSPLPITCWSGGRRGSSASANRLPPSNSTYDLWSHNNLTTPPIPPFSAHCPFPAPTINCRHHQAAAPRAPPTNSQHTRYRPSARNIVVRLFPQSVRLHRSGKFSSPPGPGASPRPPPDRPGQASSPSRIRAACLYGPSKGLPSLQATAHFPVRDPQSSNSPAI